MLVFVAGLLGIIAMMLLLGRAPSFIGIVGATLLAIIIEAIFHVGSQTDATGQVVNPAGWGSTSRPGRARSSRSRTSGCSASSACSACSARSPRRFALLIFTLMLADFFDTMERWSPSAPRPASSTRRATRRTPADPHRRLARRGQRGVASVSNNTAYIESASGVGEGARTGLASVGTGVLFLVRDVLAPFVAIVPYEAADAGAGHRRVPHDAAGEGHLLG